MTRRLLPTLAALALACGCGDARLQARYQAEKQFWHAQRMVARLRLHPRGASPADIAAAEGAFRRLVERFPAREWADSAGLSAPYVRDVAELSGRAAIGLARLAEMRGDGQAALRAYERARRDFAGVLPVALEAALGRVRALERLDRAGEAAEGWARVAVEFPLVDPRDGQPIESVMDAALRAADAARDRGLGERADSLLAGAVARFAQALGRERGRPAAVALGLRIANAEKRRGRPEAAAEALRGVLGEPALGDRRHEVAFALAELWLAAGAPDSTLAYASWLEAEWPGRAGGQAALLAARALEARGDASAALPTYQAFLDRYPQHESACGFALLRRAAIFQAQGRWELASAEYHTLAARYPASEEGMEALRREVAHYARLGDSARARAVARRSLERLDRLMARSQDAGVAMLARRAQADLRLLVADWAGGVRTLEEMWRLYGTVPLGEDAAFRAARLAERELRDREQALRLYRELAESAPSGRGRTAARAEAARLAGDGG